MDSVEHCTWFTPGGFDVAPDLVDALTRTPITVCPTVNAHARAALGALPWSARAAHLRMLYAAGVPFAVGTDAGIRGSAHSGLPAALDCYRDLGLTPLDVIELATGHTARALGLADRTGTVAVGRAADLLAVHGDPTRDLTALHNVVAVLLNGTVAVAPNPVAAGTRNGDTR